MSNQNIIIRSPYPPFDERLFPYGWRSFTQDIVSINTYEISVDIVSLNKMSDPLTVKYVSINDITPGIISKIRTSNNLEVSNEMIIRNTLLNAITKEVISLNIVSTEFLITMVLENDIINYEGPYESKIVGVNRLESINPTYPFEEYSHTIVILVDNINVTNYVISWQVVIEEDSYVNSFTVNFTDNYLFTLCNPTTRFGKERVSIFVDGIEYKFLLERRTFSESPEDIAFGIWGRSIIAKLDVPYAIPIIDKEVVYNEKTEKWYCPDDSEYIPHIWQTSDRMASEIMQDVIGNGFTLQMNIADFVVKTGYFTVSNESPIEVVNRLAGVVGAIVRTNLDGDVVIRSVSFSTAGTKVSTFTDLENILMLDENFNFPSGYNKVLVRGPADEELQSSTNLSIELDDELNNDATTFEFGSDVWFRVYKSPFGIDYSISTTLGEIYSVSLDVVETLSGKDAEKSGFLDFSLNSDKPINTIISIKKYNGSTVPSTEYSFVKGYTTVTSESVEDDPVLMEYTSKYDLYKLVVQEPLVLIAEEIIARIIAKENV